MPHTRTHTYTSYTQTEVSLQRPVKIQASVGVAQSSCVDVYIVHHSQLSGRFMISLTLSPFFFFFASRCCCFLSFGRSYGGRRGRLSLGRSVVGKLFIWPLCHSRGLPDAHALQQQPLPTLDCAEARTEYNNRSAGLRVYNISA